MLYNRIVLEIRILSKYQIQAFFQPVTQKFFRDATHGALKRGTMNETCFNMFQQNVKNSCQDKSLVFYEKCSILHSLQKRVMFFLFFPVRCAVVS